MLRKEQTTITPHRVDPDPSVAMYKAAGSEIDPAGPRALSRASIDTGGRSEREEEGTRARAFHIDEVRSRRRRSARSRVSPISAPELPWAEEGRGRLVRSGREPRGAGGGAKGRQNGKITFMSIL
jgi:hypothetical protein